MPTKTTLWLRAEHRASEARSPLTPGDAEQLLNAGIQVVVERSARRCFDDNDYLGLGCQLAEPGSWREAPSGAFILGLKELPDDSSPLPHRHIYFAHAYKQQPGAEALLQRFQHGGGELLDLEYLVDGNGRRLAAFGYWAGYLGAALGLLCWAAQQQHAELAMAPVSPWEDRQALLEHLRQVTASAVGQAPPRCLVIGAAGRCGSGARALLEALALPVTGWDIEETRGGGPFPDILQYDLLVNCVLLQGPMPPFLTLPLVSEASRRLSAISDVSCDPGSPYNPLPLYSECTSFGSPAQRLLEDGLPLDMVAIDNLPSLLPRESSADFSAQLLPALLQLPHFPAAPWQANRNLFLQHCQTLKES
ncbi:saccharopine dehydrogenase [Parahaliea maris]|uniref:Saccharopine dehydrogenase [NAD(+), L-lysine-forming] n=1 Tax=Parahaliea maris TaxID=2716870 RepID=A0A5C9A798_9GAMM|nr:saccharopine dehydrogenase [Parahaliea maris]TXS95540.1 saccharopine dehydrogenase [Parahaliea maris]